jgi:radical SAM superfamily enzyme YgiQ (UPF0313 family)
VRIVPDRYEVCADVIRTWKPDVVGYCAFTGYQKNLLNLNARLKRDFSFLSVFGGPHATFFPEIIEREGVDMVCRGEGEWAMIEMLERLQRGDDFTEVQNFWVKHKGQIYKNPVRPLEPEIEKFPFPAHDLFYQFPQARNNKIRVLMTARGCPYSCSYCYNYKMKELYQGCGVPLLRHREVDGVIEEIRWIKKNYPLELIYFGTDCFTAVEGWVVKFCEQFKKNFPDLKFVVSTRPETTTETVCRALKEAGCACLYMGIESGNREIREGLLHRKMSEEKILKAAETIHRSGLRLFTFNMIAFPGETLSQAYDTMWLNVRTRSDYAWVSIFQPYPRTHLAEYAEKNGYFDGDYDKVPMSWYRRSVLRNPHRKKLQRLRPLISLTVEFPWLTKIVPLLIRLPLDPLYRFVWKIHKVYCYRFRVLPVKHSPGEILRIGWKYLFDRAS